MSDAKLRNLERALDKEPENEGARHELTAALVRSARGHILWWGAPQRVHPAAIRIRLEGEFYNELTKERKTDGATGWGLAVASITDLMNLAGVYKTATLFDLSSGRWTRLHGHGGLGTDRIAFATEASTLDALGRPRDIRSQTASGPHQRRAQEFFDLPPDPINFFPELPFPRNNVGSRWRGEPIFDTEWVPENDAIVELNLFSNFATFMHLPRSKTWGIDTNLMGSGSSLPVGIYAQVFGLTVMLLDADRRPIPREQLQWAAQLGSVTLMTPAIEVCTLPLESVLGNFLVESPTDETIVVPWQPPPVYPFAWPVELHQLQVFRVRVMLHGSAQTPARMPAMFVKCVLHSLVGKGICG